jgi:hypothetical protein
MDLETGVMRRRIRLGMFIICAGVFLAIFANDLLARVNFDTARWEQPYLFPLVLPVGSDFREGLYYPAKILLQGKSPYLDYHSNYPPFTILLAVPFRLFKVDTAYLVQIAMLFGLNVVAIWGAARCAEASEEPPYQAHPGVTRGFLVFLLISFLILSSYGFLFSVERGNYDAYAQAMAILGLWLMLKAPGKVWLHAAAFSIAVHLKMYPAVLFLLPLWQSGRKSLIPLAVTNALLLFSTGPANAFQFGEVMVRYAAAPFLWVGNHSAASFSQLVNNYLIGRAAVQVPGVVFYLAPAAVWLVGVVFMWKKGFSFRRAVWFYVLSVPMMNLIPSTSHDYKLILVGPPVAIVLILLVEQLSRRDSWLPLVQTGAVMLLMVILTRSYAMLPPVMGNKYPFLLLLQVVFLWVMLTSSRDPGADSLAGEVKIAPALSS